MRYQKILNFIFAFTLLVNVSCGDEAASDCAGLLCPYVGDWRLSEVFVDGVDVPDDYSAYELNLKAPDGDNEIADYSRTFEDGNIESGTWTIGNGGTVLELMVDGNSEQYVIEDSGSGHLILVLNREDHKPGPSQLRYAFNK